MENLQPDNEEKATLLDWLRRFGSRFQTGFIVTDPSLKDNPVVFVNEAFTVITGYTYEEVHGQNLRFLQGEDTDMDFIKEIDQKLENALPVNAEVLNYKKNGTPFWNELVIQPLVDGKGEVLFNASFSLDVTNRKKDEFLLKIQEKIFTGMNEKKQLSDLLQDICHFVESFYPTGSVCSILFKEKDDSWYIGAADTVPDRLLGEIMASPKMGNNYKADDVIVLENIQEDSEQNKDSAANPIHNFQSNWSVPIMNDKEAMNGLLTVFMKKKEAPTQTQLQFMKSLAPLIQMTRMHYTQQAEYRRLAFTNPETGLPNRHASLDQLKQNSQKGYNYFVAVVEPGEYSKIVDLYGRGAADELFIQLGKRIEKIGKGKPDFVGRFSSGALMVTNKIKPDAEKYYILKIKEIVSNPFIIAGEEMFITLKVGISLSNQNEKNEEELLRRADIAASEAKKKPGTATAFYEDLQNEIISKEMTIFNELSKALTANEIDIHLQPKVNLKDGSIIGFEALARWNSPVLGQVPPSLFILAAENMGKIIELEIGVLSKVMEWQKKREEMGKKQVKVAVNISVLHFFDTSFIGMLKKLLCKYSIQSNCIVLEMTESIGLVDFARAKLIFEQLTAEGFEISVDDFGIGFSSLSYLTQLPVSELKIDRSFIQALDEPATHAVVRTIIQLAENLNLSTVAEGIEEERHIEVLRLLGCKIGQGFYYYKPMPLTEIDQLPGME
ncbi:GGDEF domain-containing protein [Filibacter tadaridae]|uniref:Phytochrome-like protein cph2 n=1 Tax=Filibacter tadaridae TaxID=2483811 RepID=A0A3P5WIC2_9BACL|nr:GGDEF domain-containing protein [Filibacter tadaridae]VDC19420.1 Phytochrome-like protein cph2 [Filibacter tadaridae]